MKEWCLSLTMQFFQTESDSPAPRKWSAVRQLSRSHSLARSHSLPRSHFLPRSDSSPVTESELHHFTTVDHLQICRDEESAQEAVHQLSDATFNTQQTDKNTRVVSV